MSTVRVRYRVVNKNQQLQPQQIVNGMLMTMPVVRYHLNFESLDIELERRAYESVEVGKEYFADFTPVEDGVDWTPKDPDGQDPPRQA